MKQAMNRTIFEIWTYPFSSPTFKFLAWENGVVREVEGGWELSEGIAEEGNGEVKVRARARERRLGRTLVPRLGLSVFSLAMVFVAKGGRRGRPIKAMIYGVPYPLHSTSSITFASSFSFHFKLTIELQPQLTGVLLIVNPFWKVIVVHQKEVLVRQQAMS